MSAQKRRRDMLNLAFSQAVHHAGSLHRLAFGQSATASGDVLRFSFGQRVPRAGSLLNVALSQVQPTTSFDFSGEIDGKAFALAAWIDGKAVDLCAFAEKLEIEHAENEAYQCRFVLQQTHHRPTAPIDLYAWYAKPIVIECVFAGSRQRVYSGVVDSVKLDFVTGKTVVSCTDRRQRMIDKLPASVVQAIGYTSPAVHGEYDNLSDELAKRLQTVPASFEFDVHGNGYLNLWRVQKPVRVIDDCVIMYTQPAVTLAEVGKVVNQVEIALHYNYPRLLQRSIEYFYESGLTACSLGYTQYPHLKALQAAVAQTGWVMGGGSLERSQPSGWAKCGTTTIGIMRTANNTDVMRGQFEAVKRWTQNVQEQYTITLTNAASIARYELLDNKVSASVDADNDTADTWENPETPEYQVETGNVFAALHFRQPALKGATFVRASNGDWVANLDTADADFAQAFETLYWTAYVQMLASHRQNTLDLDLQFIADISLKHSHRIAHQHFKGLVKVARFKHVFDLLFRTAQTSVQYRFFQNAQGTNALTQPALPERAAQTFPVYAKTQSLRRVDLTEDDDPLKFKGLLYQYSHTTFKTPNYKLVAIRIPTPEIERQSTDAAEYPRTLGYEVGIYNDDVEILI